MELRREGMQLNLHISSLPTSIARRAERTVPKWVKWRISSVKVKAVKAGIILAGRDRSGAGQMKTKGMLRE